MFATLIVMATIITFDLKVKVSVKVINFGLVSKLPNRVIQLYLERNN